MWDLKDAIFPKADLSELRNVEQKIFEEFNKIVENLYKKFADWIDTKQNFKILERQIKNLFDLIMNQKSEGGPSEEDALLAKKPLGGYSCASCEKNLVNMSGSKVEYNSWGKLPFRDPSDRLTWIGQGFSKILSKQKPETTMNKRLKLHNSHLSTEEGSHNMPKK